MTPPRNRSTLAAVAVLSLALAACGTRVDHDTIVRAAAGNGSGATGAGTGSTLPGADGSADGATGDGTADESGGAATATAEEDQQGESGARSGGSATSGSSGGGGQGRRGGPIVIGSVGTYSGPGGVAFAQGPRALQAWAAATNAKGGINGRRVQVIVMDDGADAAKGRSHVQELVEERNAVAIVASFTTTHTLAAWKSYVEKKKVPVVGGDCSTTLWSNSPMMFSQCPASATAMDGLVNIGAKYGKGKKIGGLICTESDACSHAGNHVFGDGRAAERFGLDPVYQAKISITQPDYTAECIQARNAGVELLMVTGDPNTVARVASSCRRQNFTPQFLQPGATVAADSAAKPGLSNVLASMPVFPFAGTSSSAISEFNAAWKKYGGGKAAGPAAAQGWASAKVFEKAARGAGDISRAGLAKELYTFRGERFGGLTVPLGYVAGKGTTDSKCTFYMRGSGGKWAAPVGERAVCW
ncbi:ABC transporter substrate-binding protein [Streptomyces sp. PSKA54]|uniref:ABC transporter substrate-binding protein n=1 Tax=Streptomyces himalayensis subsp. aureolus TaxID=2758039 RepID=A0A7W2D2Y0_9ACTN|nr:ABC transporter substrate-binding protein [Streptomyces himalayensis]MBA4863794.1 ABC transporter substrate-binding protein [Streptomyces himalayensis subsp. aureolus]